MEHPWLSTQADSGPGGTSLATPDLLRRNNSSKDLAEFVENAVAVNRLVLQHMAFSEGPVFRVRGRSLARDGGGDSDDGEGGGVERGAEAEEERTSSFEERRASSTLAQLDMSGFFINEIESGSSPRLDLSTLLIDVGSSSSHRSANRASASAFIHGDEDEEVERVADDAVSSYLSSGSDDCFGVYLPADEGEDDD